MTLQLFPDSSLSHGESINLVYVWDDHFNTSLWSIFYYLPIVFKFDLKNNRIAWRVWEKTWNIVTGHLAVIVLKGRVCYPILLLASCWVSLPI